MTRYILRISIMSLGILIVLLVCYQCIRNDHLPLPPAIDIFTAIERNDIKFIKAYVAQKNGFNQLNGLEHGLILHTVTYPGLTVIQSKKIIKIFLLAGCDINERSDNGTTALLAAVKDGYHSSAMFLLQNGANPNLADNMADTPMTCFYNNEKTKDLLRLLLQKGAYVHHENKSGLNALRLAQAYGRKDLVKFIKENASFESGSVPRFESVSNRGSELGSVPR